MYDSDGEDDFQDAMEYLPNGNSDTASNSTSESSMDLSRSLIEAKLALDLFMNNRFDEARAIMKPWAKDSMYHALGTGVFQFLEAVMTFEQQQIEVASQVLEQSVEVCQRFRKKNTVYQSLGRMVRRPNYDVLREEEIHAELCYAECLLLRAVLAFVEDENLISFVRGSLKMRNCLNAYKECWQILKHRNWEDCEHKGHFESGTRMGVGGYNLMLSLLPAKIMRLLEFIGFSGSRDDCKETGLTQLQIGNSLKDTLRQVLCIMVLLGYHLFVSYVIGHGEGDLDLCDTIIEQQLKNYPNGIWFQFFKARLEYVRSDFDNAIEWYTKAWQSQSEWIQFHHLCYWELMWSHCYKQDWYSSRDFADLLLHESRWSRVVYGYQKASYMCMMHNKLEPDEKKELIQLFKDIPSWKQRIAGKSIPMEKFIIKKCNRFFAQNQKLILPAVELLYLFNGFKLIGKKKHLVESFFKLIVTQSEVVERDIHFPFPYDNTCLLLLLKGMCFRYMELIGEAEECFRKVISMQKDIKDDTWLPPYATYELGVLQWIDGNTEKAIVTIENAKNDFKGFPLESRLHFRIHAALADLRNSRRKEKNTDLNIDD